MPNRPSETTLKPKIVPEEKAQFKALPKFCLAAWAVLTFAKVATCIPM